MVRHSDNGVVKARYRYQYEANAANKMLTMEETNMAMTTYERPPDERRQRSFRKGKPLHENGAVEGACLVHVGLTLLQGADKPQVARLEQQGMVKKAKPDQKDANWRFNTARTLLTDFDVDSNLSFIEIDRTSVVAERARQRTQVQNRHNDAQKSSSSTAIVVANRARGDDIVTIDSDWVKLVYDLKVPPQAPGWDLEATLIEVDEPSLIQLITNFRYLISHTGPEMTNAETCNVLEQMIEDARRLW